MVFNRAKNNKKLPLCAGFSQKISVLVVFYEDSFRKGYKLACKNNQPQGLRRRGGN